MFEDAAEPALSDEVHEPQQVHGHERHHGERRDADDHGLLGERAADEAHVVQRVHDAAEEPVDEHGVDAAVARSLRALNHHEHDSHAVHGVQAAGQPARVLLGQKRQQQKRGDDEREEDAVGAHHVHAEVLELPQHQQRYSRGQRSAHRQHVHE